MVDRPNPPIDPDPAATIADLLPAYALGILSPAARARVEAHLATDEASRDVLVGYQGVIDSLPLLADEREPPAHLRRHLLDAAARDLIAPPRAPRPATTDTEAVPPPPQRLPRRPSLAWFRTPRPAVLAASVLLFISIGLGSWGAALRGDLAAQQALNGQLQAQLADQQQHAAQLQAQLAQREARIAVLEAQPRVTIYAVAGTRDAPNASGEVVYLAQQQTAFLSVQNLPPAPAGRAYQVWFIQGDRPVDAGLLAPNPSQATRLRGDLSQVQAIAVSQEPAGGSPQPTGPIVLQAPLRAGNA